MLLPQLEFQADSLMEGENVQCLGLYQTSRVMDGSCHGITRFFELPGFHTCRLQGEIGSGQRLNARLGAFGPRLR